MPKTLYQNKAINQGFSIVEAVAALAIASILIGVTGPLFVAQRQENVRSEILSGAKSVGVRCMEILRQKDIASLPVSDTFNSATPACAPTTGTQEEQTAAFNQMRTQMGTQYTIATRVRVATLDPDSLTNANGDGNFQCSASGGSGTSSSTGSRCITVQVSWNGQVMYTVSSIYAALGVSQ